MYKAITTTLTSTTNSTEPQFLSFPPLPDAEDPEKETPRSNPPGTEIGRGFFRGRPRPRLMGVGPEPDVPAAEEIDA